MWSGASPSNIVNTAAALIAAAIVIAALTLAREILIPLAIAGLFSFALQPLVHWLNDYRVPRPAAVGLAVFALLTILGLAAASLTREAAQFAEDLPKYEYNLRVKVRDIAAKLEGAVIWRTASGVLSRVEGEIKRTKPEVGPVKVEVEPKPSHQFAELLAYLQLSISSIASVGLALLFTFFILLQYHDLRDRLVRLMGTAEIGRSTQALNEAALELASFFRLQAGLNLSFGFVIAVALWAIGIPNAPLWGGVAALLRFVPYIGVTISAFIPLALAASIEAGWWKLILTGALFVVVEFAVSQIIEPLLFGSKTRLSPLAVLLAAAFWTAIWGPIGLLLAVPITLALLVFSEHMPFLSFFGVLLGNEPALTPEQHLYHLLLAGDASSAADDMYECLEDGHSLVEYLDRVAMPALAIAATDSTRGVLRAQQLDKLKNAAQEFVNLAKEIVELRPGQQHGDTGAHGAPLTKVLVIAARGAFDQAASELFTLAAKLEGRIDANCAASGGLLGISASATDPMLRDVEYAALVSAGGVTAPQLGLLIKRLQHAFPAVHFGVLAGAGLYDLLSNESEHSPVVGFAESSETLLDNVKIKATPKPSPAPVLSSAGAPEDPPHATTTAYRDTALS